MYTKNLNNLMRLLQTSRQSGLLIVELAEQDEVHWQGKIHFVSGQLTSCYVYRKVDNHILLSDNEALNWLSTQIKLNWHMEEEESSYADMHDHQLLPPPQDNPRINRGYGNMPPAAVNYVLSLSPVWIPRRSQKGMVTSAQSLETIDHLRTFTLVNGQNSVDGIARLLRKPIREIAVILESLRERDLIE
ncbi:MAG TPA: hypothetical protein VFN35_30590 [Ktedonobacteraceae bacterium]|nr:hypothetical protein [Ktedonobacteraceae bacterium]